MSITATPNNAAQLPDPEHALTATGNLRRRQLINRIVESGTQLAAVIAVGALAMVIYFVAKRGASVISWSFLTGHLGLAGGDGSDMGPAFAGTAMLTAISLLFAMPIGVLVALYMTEFAGPRTSRALSTFIGMMNGLPSIVVGVFIFATIVATFKESAIAGGIANAIVVMPLVSISCAEALRRVPTTYREAADALGVARWRAIIGIVLPTASGGILTSAILAGARAAGETAPILFCCWVIAGQGYNLDPRHAVASVPQQIYILINSNGSTQALQHAFGAGLVLLVMILLANVLARFILTRSNKKRGL